jgi:ATP-binding cassette, subfamily B, bacterial PglK
MKVSVLERVSRSTLFRSIRILPSSDHRKLLITSFLQITLAVIDLIGVAVIGIVGALAVTGVQSQSPGSRLGQILEVLHLDNFSFQSQVAILAGIACTILILRTLFSVLATRRIYFFLSRRGATISGNLVSKLLSQTLTEVQTRSSQETIYSLSSGVMAITLGVVGGAISFLADFSLLMVLLLGLMIVDPLVAVTSMAFFGLLGLTLYKLMNVKALRLGHENARLTVGSNERIAEVLESYREIFVRNRRMYYAHEIGILRMKLANVLAEIQFIPSVSKYVIESSIVLGAILIAGVQFAVHDAKQAVAALAVFLAAGTRIAPAIMRLQQNLILIRNSVGAAIPTLELIESLSRVTQNMNLELEPETEHDGFEPKVEINNVTFLYPKSEELALNEISLLIKPGQSLAIVGPSGAGKTTIVDVLLGLLHPSEGSVKISDLDPVDAIKKWPGAMAYVPQDVKLINGTFRENIGMGFSVKYVSDEACYRALEVAQLDGFVASLPLGLETQIGERGIKLSGGQRQRLGIARAMFTNPKLLVLDEATSALDAQTEFAVAGGINSLSGSVTVLTIAHRLSTVKNSDQVIYMSKGEILASGSFEQVRSLVPDFEIQAKLMGL